MHYDGMISTTLDVLVKTQVCFVAGALGVFKTKRTADGALTDDAPLFQMFQCINAPAVGHGGQTLLTNTAHLLRDGLSQSQRELLTNKTWTVYTGKNTVFGGDLLTLPLIVRNQETGNHVLRWHEPW